MNDFLKYLYYRCTPGKKRWYPMLSVYYLTYRCRFRCPYCSDGSGKPYYELDFHEPPGAGAIDILKKIREYCDYVVITGGEPLEHPEFSLVMETISSLKFKEVALTTNGYDLERYLPVVAGAVDTLVFSLDTLDHGKADSWYGVGPGALEKILDNLQRAVDYKNRRYKISISGVVTPGNIEDLYDVYDFARRRNIMFSASPQLVGVKAPAGLMNNPAYRRFYDFLIHKKKNREPVFGTRSYLEYMRDFRDFRCYPFTMLVVGPSGEVFYPCLEIGHFAGNIMETKTLHRLRRRAAETFGPQPVCDNRCHSPCALGFSLLFKNPFPYIYQDHLMRKGAVTGKKPAFTENGA